MAAFYLKGVAPPHVKLTDIFSGALPFVFMVFLTMILVYIFPGWRCGCRTISIRRGDLRPARRWRMSLCALGLIEAAAEIREGRITSEELVADCLERIEEVDGEGPGLGISRSRSRPAPRPTPPTSTAATAEPTGPLHGVPIGIKDIFDTGDMPTEFGSPLWAGRTPRRDAAAVARLRAAGAVIMGKTVTTEYAYYHPGKTSNPHDPERTPGGSSSGSAAAVAAYMVPGAIGSQTNGSVIRPASYCGVVGFKPTHGLIPRSGALLLSRALDHVGVFARIGGGCRPAGRGYRRLRRRGPGYPADRAPAAAPTWQRASRRCRRASRSCARRPGRKPRR